MQPDEEGKKLCAERALSAIAATRRQRHRHQQQQQQQQRQHIRPPEPPAAVWLPDGRSLSITVAAPVSGGSTKVVRGEGMPISKQPGSKGDLVVTWEVDTNITLSQQQEAALRQILPAQ